MNYSHRKRNGKGWTIVELMMVVGLLGLIVPSLTSLFIYCYQGMATAEIHLSLKALNEQMMLHLHERINSSKHMFQNNTASGGLNFITRIQMGSAPASVSFSQMALEQSGAVNTFSPAAGAVVTEFGDCLFYAAADIPQTINGTSYLAPITISGAAVTNHLNEATTVNLDVYRFYFDYLSSVGDLKPVAGLTSYWLIEWQSVQFVDAFELNDIISADAALGKSVIKYLTTTLSNPITLAWDPSQSAMTSGTNFAFYDLSGSTMTGNSAQTILAQNWWPLTRTSSGLISHYSYGISGNYSNTAGNPPPPAVPLYASAASSAANIFPGGFEVGIQGANGGMQILCRSLLIAKGNVKGVLWDNQESISNCRDLW